MLPRSLLNLAIFFGLWASVWLPIALVVARWVDWQQDRPLNSKQKLVLLISLYSLAPWIVWLEISQASVSFSDLGLIWHPRLYFALGWGVVLSIVTSGFIFGLESWLGLLRWNWHNLKLLLPIILPIFALGLAVSTIEELVFRGYAMKILQADFAYFVAAIVSSSIFALLHLIWERRETLPQLPGLWLMGMVLVGATWLDRGNLGLAIGMHTGWIWFLSCLDSAELITYNQNDRQLLTGIDRQPLAGAAGILCLSIAGLCLWLFFKLFMVHSSLLFE
jgi:uncharacterized protein